ncbi:hypothetical protein BHM03_00043624 [Ensete ventricosum]|nr:hypothetical protein BHM03_00043624 [Ensete ventricosum]
MQWELAGSSSKDRELTRSTSGVRRKMIENLTKSSLEDAGKFTERSEDRLTCWTTRMIVELILLTWKVVNRRYKSGMKLYKKYSFQDSRR